MTNQSKETLSVDPIDLIEDAEEPTITETQHLYWLEAPYEERGGKFMLMPSNKVGAPFVYVKPVEVTVAVPAHFDVSSAKLAGLREEEKRVRAEFQARITELQRQQSELLAIEMVEAA